jgi:hypothetical protein
MSEYTSHVSFCLKNWAIDWSLIEFYSIDKFNLRNLLYYQSKVAILDFIDELIFSAVYFSFEKLSSLKH